MGPDCGSDIVTGYAYHVCYGIVSLTVTNQPNRWNPRPHVTVRVVQMVRVRASSPLTLSGHSLTISEYAQRPQLMLDQYRV